MSWAGLRGAVPIVLATFPLTDGYPEGQLIFDVVFFVVVVSVLVQGFTLEPAGDDAWGSGPSPPSLATVAEALPLDAPGVEALEIEVGSSADRRPAAPRGAAAARSTRGGGAARRRGRGGHRGPPWRPATGWSSSGRPSRPARRPRGLGGRPGGAPAEPP